MSFNSNFVYSFCRVRNEVGFNYNNCFYLMNNIYFLGVNCEVMAERGSIKKRSSSGSNEGQKKRKYEATDTTKCCLISCCGNVNENEDRVEVKTCNMNTTKKKYVVSWSVRGEAVFHRICWDNVLRNARVRNPKNATILINSEEKLMIKEAAKTAEYHDSEIKLNESAFKIASLIRKANYCVAFTGAGISTSAGIGTI